MTKPKVHKNYVQFSVFDTKLEFWNLVKILQTQ